MTNLSLKQYAKEESEKILNGERLLSEREIMVRWNYNPNNQQETKACKKLLWKLRTGRHTSGVKLDFIQLNFETRRYRLADLMRVEMALKR